MSTHRTLAAAAASVAAALLTAASATAAVAPEPGRAQPAATTPQSASTTDVVLTGEHALPYLSRRARAEAFAAQRGADLSDYPGGGAGTSNGALSAAQRGEPVGAGGTSGGSWSPFALASEG